MRAARDIAWDDPTEVIPAFTILAGIPLPYSIADGLALGFLVHPVVKALARRGKEAGILLKLLALVLAAYFVFVRGSFQSSRHRAHRQVPEARSIIAS